MGKRKRPGQTAWRALLLWPLVCTGGNGSGGVRPGAGSGADLLAVLHPVRFCRLPEGSDSPPNGSEKQV